MRTMLLRLTLRLMDRGTGQFIASHCLMELHRTGALHENVDIGATRSRGYTAVDLLNIEIPLLQQ